MTTRRDRRAQTKKAVFTLATALLALLPAGASLGAESPPGTMIDRSPNAWSSDSTMNYLAWVSTDVVERVLSGAPDAADTGLSPWFQESIRRDVLLLIQRDASGTAAAPTSPPVPYQPATAQEQEEQNELLRSAGSFAVATVVAVVPGLCPAITRSLGERSHPCDRLTVRIDENLGTPPAYLVRDPDQLLHVGQEVFILDSQPLLKLGKRQILDPTVSVNRPFTVGDRVLMTIPLLVPATQSVPVSSRGLVRVEEGGVLRHRNADTPASEPLRLDDLRARFAVGNQGR